MNTLDVLMKDITNIGLTLDIIGAILIFLFGVPKQPFFRRYDQVVITNENKSEVIEKALSFLWWSLEYLGLVFLIAGFLLQIVGRT